MPHRRRSRGPWLAATALPAIAVLAGLIWQAHAEAALARCRERLQAGDVAEARRALASLPFSPFRREALRGARLLVEALEGEATPAALPPAAFDGFQLDALLNATLLRGDVAGMGRLAQALEASGRVEAGPYRAAAALEAGDDDDAARRLESLPASGRRHWAARRVDAALRRQRGGARTLVWDRHGQAVGWLDGDGALQLEDGVDPALIPEAAKSALREASPGSGARLSLDLGLSALARDALGEERGTIVLLDPATGAVLAAVSDARTRRENATPALEQMREPASIAKLITTAAALRQGLDPDAEIRRLECRGVRAYPSGMLWCPWAGGPLSGLRQALAVSCNVSFAELGARVGRTALVEEYRRWGYVLPDEECPPGGARIVHPEGDERQLGDLAIGLEATGTTPLHAARMAAVFAAGGAMPAARFVVADEGRLGLTPQPLPRPAPRPVLEPAWLPRFMDALEGVTAPGGTAAGLAPPRFPVAMKTGTAALPGQGYHVNYVGVGPLPDPRVAFCVRVTHQRNSRRIRRSGRRVTAELLRGLGDRVPALAFAGRADPIDPPAPRD